MHVLIDSMRSETPRPKSPGMNNEVNIKLITKLNVKCVFNDFYFLIGTNRISTLSCC